MKKRLFHKTISLLLTFVLLMSMAPTVSHASEQNRFVLAAEIGGQLVIKPEYVSYTEGQTIGEALADSGHTFTGLEAGWVTDIDGVHSDSLVRSDQNGNFDLNIPASQVTHYRFCENSGETDSKPNEGVLKLMTAMADYSQEEPDVQQAAKSAYDSAVAGFVGAESAAATALAENITEAIRVYKDSLASDTFAVTFEGFTDATYNGITITAENENGKVWTDDGDSVMQLPAGTYQFRISHGGNHITGQSVVSGSTTIRAQFPTVEWLNCSTMQFSDAYDADFEAGVLPGASWQGRTATVPVQDTFTGTIYTYAEYQNLSSAPKLEAIYTNAAGEDVCQELAFDSKKVGPTQVLNRSAESNRVIYRVSSADDQGYLISQDYTVDFTRIPTLTDILVKDQNGRVQAATEKFASNLTEYTYKVLREVTELVIAPRALDSSYEVLVNGQNAASGVTVPIAKDASGAPAETTVKVEVRASGASNTYTLRVIPGAGEKITFKTTAANVELKVVNRDGLELPYTKYVGNDKYNRYLYTLVPGEQYHYVATRDQYFFAEDTFTLGKDSVITVNVPAESWLENVTLRNGSSKTSAEYRLDKAFDPSNHHYNVVVPDNANMMYTWANSIPGDVTIECIFKQIDRSQAAHGVESRKTITSGAASGTSMMKMLMRENALGNSFQIRLTKKDPNSGVSFYQDYVFDVSRMLTLKNLTVKDGSNTIPISQKKGGKQKFQSDVLEYTVKVPSAQKSLDITGVAYPQTAFNVCYGQENSGYKVAVNGVDVTGTTSVELSGTMATEKITVTVSNSYAPDSSTDYVITVQKAAPVQVTVNTQPKDAMLFVTERVSLNRIWPENGTVKLSEGFLYDYTLTKPGYVGQRGTMQISRTSNKQMVLVLNGKEMPVVPGADGESGSITLNVELKKSAENTTIDHSIVSQWPNFGGNDYHNAVVDAPIPYRADDAALYWATKFGQNPMGKDAVGCPIVVEGDLITYSDRTIYRLDAMTGKILASSDMAGTSSFAITPPTYADGMVFVQLGNGTIQAFNAKTLESLWVYHDPLKGQGNTPITVSNGFLYTGFWGSEKNTANFVCLSVHDEDPSVPNEEKAATWRFSQAGGFYWAGAHATEEYVLVGTDDGQNGCDSQTGRLLLLDSRTGKLMDSWENLNGDVRSNISYDTDTDAFYFTSKGGSFYSVQVVKENGSWKLTNKWNLTLQNGVSKMAMSTSTPVVHHGRAYIGVCGSSQFGSYTGHNITVIDLSRKAIAYSVATQGYPQTSGLVSTAYEESTGYVYIYFIENITPGRVRVLRDKAGQNAPDYVVQEDGKEVAYPLFTPVGDQAQYAICSPLVDDYGTLYFKNDAGYLMAVGSTITKLELTAKPNKTEYKTGEKFDPAGMVVTATYANGKTRDVTEYVTWQQDALAADATAVSVQFPYVMYQNEENGDEMLSGVTLPKPHVDVPIQMTDGKPQLGDVNEDKVINAEDAKMILQAEAENQKLDAKLADVSGDGLVDSNDAVLILQFAAGKLTEFPAKSK